MPPGDFRSPFTVGVHTSFAARSGLWSLNAAGEVAFSAFFSDFSSAVFVVTIPEPGTAGLLALGLGLLAAQRRRA